MAGRVESSSLITALILLALFAVAANGIDVTIQGLGTVRGTTSNGTGNLVDQFWKVPFAKPPVGALRFAPPQPSVSWSGIRNATHSLFFCPQYPFSGNGLEPSKVSAGSEDCLYLNIFRPRKAATRKMPVMVWVHGGGYVMGAASNYDGEIIAGTSDVVIVAISYRLGVLGFFNVPGTKQKGNFGLLDQIEALKWVKQHIGSFGGDPSRVTIFGESAGGGSVSLLMLSPLAKGLFARVIAQSGSALNPWAAHKERSTTQAKEYLSLAGCNGLKTATDCLRKKPWKDMLRWQRASSNLTSLYAPSADGNVLTGLPIQQMKENKLPVTQVDLMIGFNTDEGSVFVPKVRQWTKGLYDTLLGQTVRLHFKNETALVTKLVSFQYRSFTKPPSSDFKRGYEKFLDDHFFKQGIIDLAVEWSRKIKNTYLYNFAYMPKFMRIPEWGVAHGLELEYIFGLPLAGESTKRWFLKNATEEDRKMSRKMMKLWTDFAKTGKPGMGFVSIDAVKKQYNVIGSNITVKENYDPKMMTFWNDYIPGMVKMKSDAQKKDCVGSGAGTTYRGNLEFIVPFLAIIAFLCDRCFLEAEF